MPFLFICRCYIAQWQFLKCYTRIYNEGFQGFQCAYWHWPLNITYSTKSIKVVPYFCIHILFHSTVPVSVPQWRTYWLSWQIDLTNNVCIYEGFRVTVELFYLQKTRTGCTLRRIVNTMCIQMKKSQAQM